MSRWRVERNKEQEAFRKRKEAFTNPYLAKFLMQRRLVVCGSTHIDWPDCIVDKCVKCGKEVMASYILKDNPKLCVNCAPN